MPTEFRPPPSINPHRQQGVAADLLDLLLELFRRRAEAGFGHEDSQASSSWSCAMTVSGMKATTAPQQQWPLP